MALATTLSGLLLASWIVAAEAPDAQPRPAAAPPAATVQPDVVSPEGPPGFDPAETDLPPVWASPTTLDRVGRIMAPVLVNGRGPFRFVVDTGASRSALAPHVAAELGIEPDPERLVSLRGVTGTEQVPSLLVDELRAGDLVLEQQLLPVLRPSVFADADGILGTEGLEGMCLQVMFARNEVEIHDRRCPRSRLEWLRVLTRMRDDRLVTVGARIGRTRVTAIVDTGAQRSLGNLVLLQALEEERRMEGASGQATVTGATEHAVSGSIVRSPTISFGEMNITNLNVVFGDFEVFRLWQLEDQPAILLGMDVLGTVDGLKIDYRRRQILFLAAGAGDSAASRIDSR